MLRYLLIASVLLVQPVLAQDRVSRFDANDDKKVELAELTTKCEITKALFDRADKNNDGYLSNAEMQAAKGYIFSRCESKHA